MVKRANEVINLVHIYQNIWLTYRNFHICAWLVSAVLPETICLKSTCDTTIKMVSIMLTRIIAFKNIDFLNSNLEWIDDKRANTEDGQSIDNRLADFFTMRCDICSDTQFSSFQHAKLHYKSVHGVTGYLVCCNKKFVKAKTVDNHLQWHINPELNK